MGVIETAFRVTTRTPNCTDDAHVRGAGARARLVHEHHQLLDAKMQQPTLEKPNLSDGKGGWPKMEMIDEDVGGMREETSPENHHETDPKERARRDATMPA